MRSRIGKTVAAVALASTIFGAGAISGGITTNPGGGDNVSKVVKVRNGSVTVDTGVLLCNKGKVVSMKKIAATGQYTARCL